MPFSTDATWPAGMLKLFEVFTADPPLKNRYVGLYFRLLTYCFGNDFFVTLQSIPTKHPPSDTDFAVFFVVIDIRRRPVFIIQIEEDDWTTKANLRFKADKQMRLGYESMLSDVPVPRLWGLSLLGASLRIYCGNPTSGDIEPAFEDCPNPGGMLPPNFLEEWNINIFSQEGFDRMKEMVKDIIDGEATLQ